MTTFFWALWLAISVFIFGIFFWTTQALFEQKKAWKAFAVKKGLKYFPNKFLSSPILTGLIDGHEFTLQSELRDTGDLRGRKFKTVMQFGLPMRMQTAAVIGSGDFTTFVRGLTARDDLTIAFEGLPEGFVLGRSDDKDKLEGYFTPERLKVLETLMKQKNVSVLFLFDTRLAFIRLETIDPLIKQAQLEKLVDKIVPMLKVLQP